MRNKRKQRRLIKVATAMALMPLPLSGVVNSLNSKLVKVYDSECYNQQNSYFDTLKVSLFSENIASESYQAQLVALQLTQVQAAEEAESVEEDTQTIALTIDSDYIIEDGEPMDYDYADEECCNVDDSESNPEPVTEEITEEEIVEATPSDETEVSYTDYSVPSNKGFKSYMPYTAITSKSSPQYKLQQLCSTDSAGLRMYDGRYCVALGSHFGCEIGDYFDLILENGIVIPCVMADQKANKDTDSKNIFTGNGCCTEFLVSSKALDSTVKKMGDVSYAYEGWDSPVVSVRVYN